MAGLQELRSQAKALGIPGSLIRTNMNDADKLSDLIVSFQKGKAHADEVKSQTKVKSNKGGTKVAKPVARAKAKAKAKSMTRAPRKRTTSTTAAKRNTATTRKARTTRTVSKPKVTTTRKVSSGDAGRHTIGKVNFKITEGWNPREGSAVEEIFLAIKKAKGDREAAFNTLKPRVWEFVGRTMADGSKRDKASALNMLKYRISRTLYDFVIQTGQHKSSTNRVEYGTGGTGNGTRKKATARKAVSKATASAPKKRGRPKGSTHKARATKPAARRTTRRTARAGRR